MTKVFADSAYWIALINPADQLHATAQRVSRKVGAAEIFTSEMVLVEALNSFSGGGAWLRQLAANAVHGLRRNHHVVVQPQTAAQFEAGLRRYELSRDKAWSLTDCVSFHIMESEGIEAALTHNRHFVQAGFKALLR